VAAEFRIGTAGWALPPLLRPVREGSTGLERYAERFNAVEINSTHYKHHLPGTFKRWRNAVPADFGFAVKMHREVTHIDRLSDPAPALHFLRSLEELGEKLSVVLIQLPPSLSCSPVVLDTVHAIREEYAGDLALEPRHPDWGTPEVDRVLRLERIARVAADPALVEDRPTPGGHRDLRYYRLHGSPDMYWSAYSDADLRRQKRSIDAHSMKSRACWVMFDNTASGLAAFNALHLRDLLCAHAGKNEQRPRPIRTAGAWKAH
jgi:uncharacterized protein YecE (DUF72 family)